MKHYSMIKINCLIIIAFLLVAAEADAQTFTGTFGVHRFSVTVPDGWIQIPPTSPNTQARFASPVGKPAAECAVIAKSYRGAAGLTQEQLDQIMLDIPTPEEFRQQLSVTYNNVSIFGVGSFTISGYPGYIVKQQSSIGTQLGQLWTSGTMVVFATTPGLVWTIACGGTAYDQSNAQNNYHYWQSSALSFSRTFLIY